MKKHDLQPTDDNIRKTFYNDSIGRNKDLVNFIKIIDSIDESYSIALDSYWGSGKTFFVKQIKMMLDAETEKSYTKVEGETAILSKWVQISNNMPLKKHVPIYYDAWQNDCDEDPIYSLIYKMMVDTGTISGLTEKINYKDLINVAGKITGFLAGKISDKLLGFNPDELLESLNKKSFLEDLEQSKSINKYIEEYIDKLLPKGCDRLLIIIDELDRCNPEFAVKLLERIKHYFNNDKVTFVFAVNLAELQITIRKYYGNEFNASRYLDRFFDLRVTLPPPDMEKFYSLIGFGSNFGMIGSLDGIMRAVFRRNNMQMRDCIKYVSLMKAVNFDLIRTCSYEINARVCSDNVIFKTIIPVLWGEMINNIFLYNRFMRENDCSLLTSFYNDTSTIDIVRSTLLYLFDDSEKDDMFPDFDFEDDIKKLHIKLREFYHALMNEKGEVFIGQCLVSDRERDLFRKTTALLSDNIMLEENKAEIGV